MRNLIKLKPDAEKIELLKAMGSRSREESSKATEAFAALVGPVIPQVLDQVSTSAKIYSTQTYDMNTTPSIPMDLFQDNEEGLFQIWSNTMAGGLATQEVWGSDEYRFRTYNLDSAISFAKKYLREARVDVAAKAIQRLIQEVLVKQEYHAWTAVLAALAEYRDPVSGDPNLIDATTGGQFQLDDMNRLWTLVKRLRKSWVGGSPMSTPGRGLTDIFVSPEVVENIRAMAYNPVNTTAIPDTAESTALGLPDALRMQIYSNPGLPSIYGVTINELLEFGVGQSLNALFDQYYTAGGGEPAFANATEELVFGADLSLEGAIRVIASNADTGSTFELQPDDQFVARQDKVGFWGGLTEGRIILDTKCFVGCVV